MKKEDIIINLAGGFYIKIVSTKDINDDYLITLNDPQSLQYLGIANNFKYNKELLTLYIKDQYNSKKSYLFGLYNKDKYLVATSRIHDIEDQNAWQGVLVFNNFQKKGNGYLLIKNLSSYLLELFSLSRVSAGILKENVSSLKLFCKCGFTYLKDDPEYVGRQIWIKEIV